VVRRRARVSRAPTTRCGHGLLALEWVTINGFGFSDRGGLLVDDFGFWGGRSG